MLHNQEKLEEIHTELSELEVKNHKAMELALEKRIRFKKEEAKAKLSGPATKAEATVIDEYPEEWEEYYKAYYTAPIIAEKIKSKRREYYHEKNGSETNTMLDVEASRMGEQY